MAERGNSLGRVFKAARAALAVSAVALLSASMMQCATDTGAGGGNGASSNGGSSASSNGGSGNWSNGGNKWDSGLDVHVQDGYGDAFFPPDDPPPTSCDGGGNWTWPGGTEECPWDKNYQGCPCIVDGKDVPEGTTAACWPGLRKNRNRGNCADGVTTCIRAGEIQLVWGPCEGYKGIDPVSYMPLGTSGKAACTCFSGGYWDIANTSPCFYFSDAAFTQSIGAISTLKSTGQCPDLPATYWDNPTVPADPWSGNTVKADCTGHFKLCFTIKAFSTPNGPKQATDCVVQEVCTQADYTVANQTQPFPDLPGWVTAAPAERACAQTFVTNGGYAEMSVDGESNECDKVKKVFQTVTYCPFKCNDAAHAQDPECVNCQQGGGGPF